MIAFSFVIPVFNRPQEIRELLESMRFQTNANFEVIVIEDGSKEMCNKVCEEFQDSLKIKYFYKENSGPGDSRNFGMKKASGNYFIILDSDVILPDNYLKTVNTFLKKSFYHCFGGPDDAHPSFSPLQKAINFALTSNITTGGIRGGTKALECFQPRSFNMGLSKEAFKASGGFGEIHPGEDPDLSIRLWKLQFKTTLIKEARVFHKRRISWKKFYEQVYKFGLVRRILNLWHPSYKRRIFWLPTLFCLSFLVAIILLFVGFIWPVLCFGTYFLIAFFSALINTKSILIAILAVPAIFIQFFGYGLGFLRATFVLSIFNKKPEIAFPELFFKKIS